MPRRIARMRFYFPSETGHAQKIPRPHDLYAMAAHAVSKETSAVWIVAQHQSLPLLARLRRRTLPPRPHLSGSRMLLAAAAKTAEHRRDVAGAQKGRDLDVAVVA